MIIFSRSKENPRTWTISDDSQARLIWRGSSFELRYNRFQTRYAKTKPCVIFRIFFSLKGINVLVTYFMQKTVKTNWVNSTESVRTRKASKSESKRGGKGWSGERAGRGRYGLVKKALIEGWKKKRIRELGWRMYKRIDRETKDKRTKRQSTHSQNARVRLKDSQMNL